MPTVRLEFTPTPAHVRTARLVAAAVARRCGVAEDLLDEVRLAVGEACSRAVALHRKFQVTQPIAVEMTDGDQFSVQVTDLAPNDPDAAAPDAPAELDLARTPVDVDQADPIATADVYRDDGIDLGVSLALLAGLVDDLQVTAHSNGLGTIIRMAWPVSPN